MYTREVCILQRGGVFRNEIHPLEGRVCTPWVRTSLRGGVFRCETHSHIANYAASPLFVAMEGTLGCVHRYEGVYFAKKKGPLHRNEQGRGCVLRNVRVCFATKYTPCRGRCVISQRGVHFTTRVCISQRTRVPSIATNQGAKNTSLSSPKETHISYTYTHFYTHIRIHICCERGSKEFKSKSSLLTVQVSTGERWGAGVEYHFQEFNEPYAPS